MNKQGCVILFFVIILVFYFFRVKRENYGSAIFKVGNRVSRGNKLITCNLRYKHCMNGGVYSKDYCDRNYKACRISACMSPY